jgi:hypothetical protein
LALLSTVQYFYWNKLIIQTLMSSENGQI